MHTVLMEATQPFDTAAQKKVRTSTVPPGDIQWGPQAIFNFHFGAYVT